MAHLLRVLSLLRVHVVSLFTAELGDGQQLVDMFLASPLDVDRATIVHGISVGRLRRHRRPRPARRTPATSRPASCTSARGWCSTLT